MFTSTAMHTNGLIVNNQISPAAFLKQRILLARITFRNIKKFMQPQQVRQSIDTGSNQFIVTTENKMFTGSFQKPGFKTFIDGSDYKSTASPVKIIDIKSNNVTDVSGNTASMTPAQVVYATIYVQQIEWMKSARNSSGNAMKQNLL